MMLRVLVMDDNEESVYGYLRKALVPFLSEARRNEGPLTPDLQKKIENEETIALDCLGAEVLFQYNSSGDFTNVMRAVESGKFNDPVDLVLLDDNWGGGDAEYAGQEKLLKPVFENIRTRYNEPPVITLWTRHWDDKNHTGRFTELLGDETFWGSDGLSKITGFMKRDVASLRVQIQRIVGERKLTARRRQAEQRAAQAEKENKVLRALNQIPIDIKLEDCPKSLPGTSLVSDSDLMRIVYLKTKKYASHDNPVFIHGESGTGKELIAKALWSLSSHRRGNSFVPYNCAASRSGDQSIDADLFGVKGSKFSNVQTDIGVISKAEGGVLFLDEISEMSPGLQSKLLRFLQEGEYRMVGGTEFIASDVRVIGASHKSLREEMHAGRFREDLYHRIGEASIYIPPLRDRPEDIPSLVQKICNDWQSEKGGQPRFSDKAVEALQSQYSWPGNVRELINVVRDLLIWTSPVTSLVTVDAVTGKLESMRETNQRQKLTRHSTGTSESHDKKDREDVNNRGVNTHGIPPSLQQDMKRARGAEGCLDKMEKICGKLKTQGKPLTNSNIGELNTEKGKPKPVSSQAVSGWYNKYKAEFKAWGEASPSRWPLVRETKAWKNLQQRN